MGTRTECCGWSSWGELAGIGRDGRRIERPLTYGRTRVVIVGGGFSGLATARALAGTQDVDVTLIDRTNYHLFQPLLYQVATTSLSPNEIAYPIRAALGGQRNARVLLGEMTDIDLDARVVRLSDGTAVSYDHLVLAPGFRSRVVVTLEWAWAYITRQRSVRLILAPFAHMHRSPEHQPAPDVAQCATALRSSAA